LVVGAGPAGCSAARAASKNGANTILIEKEKQISQISCAEGLGSYLFPLLPFKISKELLIWRIKGMYFSDGNNNIIQKGNFYKGWSIDREIFDNWMLTKAQEMGVKTFMGTNLIDMNFSNEYHVKKVIAKKGNKKISIEPSVIIAADGVESTVANKLEIIKPNSKGIGHVYSWEMKNISLEYPHLEHIYFGDFAPRAYAYIFPKSKNTANVGVGSTKGDKNLEKYFNIFIKEIIPSKMKNALRTVDRSGKAPIKYIIPKWKYGNVIFTGDAANQNFKPYIEGILPAIICGDIAGKTAASKKNLNYEQLIKNKIGKQFKKSDEILDKIYKLDQIKGVKKELLYMYLHIFQDVNKLDELINKNTEYIRKELFRKCNSVNRFITMLRYFVWYSKVLSTRRD
jgi:digeranylgeranylglycerophospholipid reductase